MNKRVLIIVPHEDDEVNLAGGLIERYREGGSEIYILFITNGDYFGAVEIRLSETVECCKNMGIDKDHIILLGYGDDWQECKPHIYNAGPDEVMTSYSGHTKTYGVLDFPVLHDGKTYTKNHLKEDLKEAILSVNPDVIFCSDYDIHADHRAVSLLFEKVMGEILRETTQYKPLVYKGFAYVTAWNAEKDFYTLNIKSTTNEVKDECCPQIFDWDRRVRFEVADRALGRLMCNSSEYAALKCYRSQGAAEHADRVINGDKVFWRRRTDSLLYHADIKVSSGEKRLLTDYNILDTTDVRNQDLLPDVGAWLPDPSDTERIIEIVFRQPQDISYISLYESPCLHNNIFNAVITFDDSEVIRTGELLHTGAETKIPVNKEGVKAFTIKIDDCVGDKAGFTQIEAFSSEYQENDRYFKIIDQNDNFVYDYILSDNSGFSLYSDRPIPQLNTQDYQISLSNKKCSYHIENDLLFVDCPCGENSFLEIGLKGTDIKDVVYLRQMSKAKKIVLRMCQEIERRARNNRGLIILSLINHGK